MCILQLIEHSVIVLLHVFSASTFPSRLEISAAEALGAMGLST